MPSNRLTPTAAGSQPASSPAVIPGFLALLLAFAMVVLAQPPSDAEIRKILADRVGADNTGSALVAGVVDSTGRRIIAYGSLAKNDPRKPDGNTVFEIGSMSKVFTSLLLMDMARKNELALTDAVAKFLPATVKIPQRNGKQITLADLSTQSSGLPRMPNNFNPKDPDNPYADYSVQQMYDFLSGYTLTRDIGAQYEYSNLGVGLLGHALALKGGRSWEDLVVARIATPLGMNDTRVTLSADLKARLAAGHLATLAPAANWDIPTLAGAGALRSTANDILTFLAANLSYVKSPLADAMADEVSIRKPAGPSMQIAYAWHVQTKGDNSIVWHNGGTGGYRTYMGYDPKAKVGVVVLSNVSTAEGPDDIGRHLLDASYPLLKVVPPTERKEVTLTTTTFDRYVGAYQMSPAVQMTISRAGEHFYGQLTGQGKLEIFPESDRKFFLKAVDAQLTFDVDPQGAATQVTLHQNGADMVEKKLSDADAKSAADAFAKRFKDRTAVPGSEAALRRTVLELQRGEPDDDKMTTQFAAVTKAQLPQLKTLASEQGAIQSITFKGVGPGGADIYEVKFEKTSMEFRFSLDAEGKTAGINLRPL